MICIRADAQKRVGGLSPVAADVITIIMHTSEFWPLLSQFHKTISPLVDAIGNLESRQVTLADCMLELIRCARDFNRLRLEEDDDYGFWEHAKLSFNRRFHAMNTRVHQLALFLHPFCRKLAIGQAASGRSLEFMIKVALEIAKKWNWPLERAKKLVEDMKTYHVFRGVFSGAAKDGLDWWESLPVTAEEHPLKVLAIILFSIVPHAADVE